ncbi:MAG: dual specificity protein phosphatase family protein [Candidatus Heimdallarchaeota archaeon]|nr:dual specificity protein phosphatase family protein [Candidatus Heimdallarchaeota archaeon]
MLSNFSFIDDTIAGSACPVHIDDLKEVYNAGIRHIISLTTDRPIVFLHNNLSDLLSTHLPIYSVPSENVINKFLEVVQDTQSKGGRVLIHCQFGQERTGMLLAIYLIKMKGLSADEAINEVRTLRPGSLRTHAAIDFLRNTY